MYAVIKTGGKQYKVNAGDVINVEKLPVYVGEEVVFDEVLFAETDDGVVCGKPCIEGAKVVANVVEQGKGPKIVVFKYKSKKDYRKKQGHRQPYTMVKIASLTGAAPKQEAPKAEEVHAEPAKEEAKAAKKISASMKKDELIAFAKENNIEVDEKATKAVIIETIEAALK